MSLESYRKPSADGIRHGLEFRCYRGGEIDSGSYGLPWTVERWNGERWEFIAHASSYQRCREIPDEWRNGQHRTIRRTAEEDSASALNALKGRL